MKQFHEARIFNPNNLFLKTTQQQRKQATQSIASGQTMAFIDFTFIYLAFYPKQDHGLLRKDSIYVIQFNPQNTFGTTNSQH